MPRDIQETVNRNRYNQAVSVYSPTRRITRPTGRTANAGTAQNILGGGPTQGPVGTRADFGGATTPRTSQLPGWQAAVGSPGATPPPRPLSMMDQILAQPPGASTVAPEPPGGWRGALGTVVNNPIGRGVMTALDTLSYPRRIIQSSVQEVADAFNGGDASFDDWSQQIGDEGFGFGNMVPDTGNSFLDGLIGFGGDVLMDPLTFVGGAGLYSGIAGRTARAGTAAEALALGVKVGELTAEQTSRQIARFGFSRFDDAARAELRAQLPGTAARILDRGYHFKVPLTQRFFHIPGSQPVDWLVSRGAGRVRATLSESPLGGWMRYASNPNGMRDAVTTLVTRRPAGGLTFGQAAEVVNFNNGKKLAQRSFVAKASKMFDDAVRSNGGGRSGRAALNDMYRAETTGGTALHDVYAAIRKMGIDEYGIHIPAFDGPYLPHLRTDLGQKWMEGGSQAANDFKAVLYKTVSDAPAGITKNRSLLAGRTIKIGGESYDIVDGSVDELNRIFHKAVPDVDFDLYDADALSVAHRYVKDLEESVGLVGGLKKVLGSKSGLVRSLHDESLFDRITADDIDALASRDTADVMKARWREASSTVRKMRTDNQRGISDIGGSFGVEVRAAVGEMETITPTLKKRLDDVVAEEMRKSELRGVGKYADRFFTPAAASTGSVTRVFDATRKQLETRFRNLERRLSQLKVDAAAEARRLESRGNVGATPVQDELRRLSAQQGATSQDMATMEAVIQRLETNQAAQGVIDARLGDRDFANLSVADDLSPKSGGVNPTVPVATPAYTGPSSLAVSRDFNAKRAAILGVEDPQVVEVAARYDAQAQIVDRAQRRAWEARVNNRHAVDTAHQQLLDGREYEAGLKHAVDHTRGRPDQLERHLELSQRLDDFQSGELPRRQAAFKDARRPIDDAERVHKVEAKRLAEIGDEQQAIATRIDATRGGTLRPPLSRSQESTLRSQRTRLARDRGRWLRTPEGQAHVKAQRQLELVTGRLEQTGAQVERATQGSGAFYLDADGALQTKFTTQEKWATDLIDQRANTLIPARNTAEARYETATETWQRLSTEGADVTSSELTAAQREVSTAWKAWRSAQDAVTDANQRLTKVADVPNLGRIGAEGDELRRLLTVQAQMKGRVDELTHQANVSGQPLRDLEDGIAGIDAQLQAQETARRLAAEAPATPVGAQVAALHRAEQQRLDALEAKFAGVRRDWDDAPELPAHPADLGRFEGQWEDNKVIRDALDAVNRVDGQVRTFDGMDTATDLANSAAALRAAGEPFTVPPVGTPAHAAVTSFSPASRGGAMGAVGRGQAVAAETQRVLDNHVPELVDAGAIPQEFGDDLFRRRLDLDRALDLHAANPSAHLRDDVEAQAADLGRLTNYALRYKQALEGGNEPSDALATFLLARELDDEAASLSRQIDVGNARLANPTIGASELEYTGTLARLNERAAQHTHNIEAELAKAKAGAPWDQQSVARWTSELDIVQQRINRLGPPANSSLDDTIDSHAAYLANDMRDLDDSVATFDENRFVDHRMQYPVRRRDELAAAIPHREAEVLAAKTSQRRLEDAVLRARANGSTTVRYTPYTTEGYRGGVAEMPLAQAEQNLIHNQGVIDMLEHDLVNKQVQSSVLEGTAEHRATLLEREIGDATTPPDPPALAAENDAILAAARTQERALSPAELETIASNQARIARLNQGPIPPETLTSMQEELGRLRKAIDDFGQVMGGDAARVAVARDGGEGFIASIVQGGRGPLSQADTAMLDDLVGPETAKAAGVWIHHLDEAFAGRTSVPADEVTAVLDDLSATFGDNELVDRLRQRAANIDPDGTVSLNEMRDEFASSLYASANRQRGEAIRETTSMQSLFGTSFVDGPTGLQPRYAAAAADEPSYQLLTARLRTATVEAMRAKGYDPRNAIVDQVANLRTRLGRVETMRRSIEGNDEWLDVLTTGTSSVEARRQTLQAGKEALQVEERQLLGQLDAPRQARLAEQRKLLGERVANETEPLAAALTSVQREADRVERTYTARLAELDMQLADVRVKVTEAFRDHDAHRTATDQYRRALEANPARNTESQRQAIDDLRALNEYSRGLTGVEAREADAIEAQLVAASQATAAMDAAQTTSDGFRARYAAASKNPGRVAKLTKDLLTDEWRLMARGLIEDTPEGLLVSKQLAAAIENVVPVVATPKFWQFVDRYTAFFKTYATSRPGFHVRNAISATFMNLVDGVRIRDMYEGARLWRQYERNPNFWMEAGTDPRIRDAFHAVFASGAGGAYIEPGLYTAAAGGNAMYRFLMDNALTRFNRRLGSRVEGSARLAMALNSMRGRGATAEQATRRISKFHFDYTEMSDLDHMARRVIPFWTFMSRNLPLQMEQMFTNPRMYLAYENLKRNLQEPLDPYTPDYWIAQGAFTVDAHAADRESPWYIAPDLPHLRVTEPLDAFARGEPGAAISNINPLFLAPAEAFLMGKKMYTGAELGGGGEPAQYEATSPLNPFTQLFNLLGATETAGSGDTVVDKRYAHVARSLFPPWEFAERLLDPTGKRAGRTDETVLRALGAPVYQLTPELRESTRNRAYYEQQDQYQTQADLARM